MPSRLITVGLMMLACLLGSLSSLIWSRDYHPIGRAIGVAVWMGVYGLIGASHWFRNHLRNPAFRNAVSITLMLRAALSIMLPCGMVVDIFPGMLAVGMVQSLSGDDSDPNFGITVPPFAMTVGGTAICALLQGLFLNLMLIPVAYAFYRQYRWLLEQKSAEHRPPRSCHTCGYDLRGSVEFGRCSECGTAFAQSQGTAAGSN
ncbi:MAG: hypothetical protein ACKVS9_19940 [Phycisphaerae bacterium]